MQRKEQFSVFWWSIKIRKRSSRIFIINYFGLHDMQQFFQSPLSITFLTDPQLRPLSKKQQFWTPFPRTTSYLANHSPMLKLLGKLTLRCASCFTSFNILVYSMNCAPHARGCPATYVNFFDTFLITAIGENMWCLKFFALYALTLHVNLIHNDLPFSFRFTDDFMIIKNERKNSSRKFFVRCWLPLEMLPHDRYVQKNRIKGTYI